MIDEEPTGVDDANATEFDIRGQRVDVTYHSVDVEHDASGTRTASGEIDVGC